MPSIAILSIIALPLASAAGCYTGPPNHECICVNVTNATCSHIWTTACCQAFPPPSPAPPPNAPPPCEPDHGCYDERSHRCDCKITESQCRAGAGDWTSGCGCDHTGDPGYRPCNTSSPAYGCYNGGGHHQCDCQTSEAACRATGTGMWITGCSCSLESLPPPAPAPPPLPMAGGRVTVTLHAECPAHTYLETFVREGMLQSLAELSSVATHFIVLAVGDECDTPPGAHGAAYAQLSFSVSCATMSHVAFVEAALAKAFPDAASTGFLLDIHVLDTPRIDCEGCGAMATAHLLAIGGLAAAVLVLLVLVFCCTRRYYRRGTTGALLGPNPMFSASSTPDGRSIS